MNTYFVDAVIDDVFDDLVNIKGYSESEAYKAIYQGGLTIKSTQNLQIQKICDEEVADKANYDAGTKYSFYLSFQVKEKDGTIKTYTNQTMLSYYKKKNKVRIIRSILHRRRTAGLQLHSTKKMSSGKGTSW